jgi:hypothetical protein
MYLSPRNRPTVRAFAGDSTMTRSGFDVFAKYLFLQTGDSPSSWENHWTFFIRNKFHRSTCREIPCSSNITKTELTLAADSPSFFVMSSTWIGSLKFSRRSTTRCSILKTLFSLERLSSAVLPKLALFSGEVWELDCPTTDCTYWCSMLISSRMMSTYVVSFAPTEWVSLSLYFFAEPTFSDGENVSMLFKRTVDSMNGSNFERRLYYKYVTSHPVDNLITVMRSFAKL